MDTDLPSSYSLGCDGNKISGGRIRASFAIWSIVAAHMGVSAEETSLEDFLEEQYIVSFKL